jgi:hypothetical protein
MSTSSLQLDLDLIFFNPRGGHPCMGEEIQEPLRKLQEMHLCNKLKFVFFPSLFSTHMVILWATLNDLILIKLNEHMLNKIVMEK